MITYDSICEKLGFRPLTEPSPIPSSGFEDDSKPSVFSVLTPEELDFIINCFLENLETKAS